MPHYYFNLADGVTQRDRTGIDCIDDAAAVVKAIATKVTAANGNNSRPDLQISIIHEDEHEVSPVPVKTEQGAPAAVNTSLK
jgi:hypothetical protein